MSTLHSVKWETCLKLFNLANIARMQILQQMMQNIQPNNLKSIAIIVDTNIGLKGRRFILVWYQITVIVIIRLCFSHNRDLGMSICTCLK